MGYSPQHHKKLDTIERLSIQSTHIHADNVNYIPIFYIDIIYTMRLYINIYKYGLPCGSVVKKICLPMKEACV